MNIPWDMEEWKWSLQSTGSLRSLPALLAVLWGWEIKVLAAEPCSLHYYTIPPATQASRASVSNRVIARKLEREQKKVEGGGGGEKRKRLPVSFVPLPLPLHSLFLLSSQLSRRTRTETLATQASPQVQQTAVHSHALNAVRRVMPGG